MHPFAVDFPFDTSMARETERAAQLLKAVRAGDAVAAARVRHGHARFAWMTDDTIRIAARVTEARFVVAREYGFGSWTRLREYLNALGGKREMRHLRPDCELGEHLQPSDDSLECEEKGRGECQASGRRVSSALPPDGDDRGQDEQSG